MSGGPNPDREHRLGNAISLRSSQDQVLWTIYGLFSATNSLFLVALFRTGTFPKASVGVVVSIVGLPVSIAWLLIQRRALAHIANYDGIIREIDPGLLNTKIGGPGAADVMRFIVILFALGWGSALVVSGYFVLHGMSLI